jgi:hypothetical protein
MSTLGGRGPKLIGALNLARIGEDAEPKFHNSSKIGEVWKELKN